MNRNIRIDVPMLVSFLFLIGLGVVMVYSSSWALAESTMDDTFYFLKRQAMFAVCGVIALIVGIAVNPSRYQKLAYPLVAAAFVLLVVVLIPGVGPRIGLARRWVALGSIHIQAGEVAKFVMINVFAMSIAKKSGRMDRFDIGIVPHYLLGGGAITLLLAEPDFGTSVLLGTVMLVMLFVGGARLRFLVGTVAAAVPVLVLLVLAEPYRLKRIQAFLDPWAHRFDIGYQVTESLMTLGSGGATGMGLGAGRQKLFFLPAAHTDFIFSVLGEELGFVGITSVILAFGVIAVRGAQVALRHRHQYHSLLALGITTSLVFQACFNMAVALGLVPTKGLTLPFISYGGSSLIMSSFMAGVLVRLSGEVESDVEELPLEEGIS